MEHDWGRGRTVGNVIGTVSSRAKFRQDGQVFPFGAAAGPVRVIMGTVRSRSSTAEGEAVGLVSGSDESFPSAEELMMSGHRKSKRVSSSLI